jgi:hypothetical protein
MQALRPGQFTALVGLGLLCLPLMRLVSTRAPAAVVPATAPTASARPKSPFEAALRAALQDRTRAKIAVSRELEALAAWDPEGMMDINEEPLRLQRMVAHQSELSQARAAAGRAAALARTPQEEYRAAELLVLVEHESGHHAAELRHALNLVELQPRRRQAWMILRRAAKCNGRESLVRQADEMLQALDVSTPMTPIREMESELGEAAAGSLSTLSAISLPHMS